MKPIIIANWKNKPKTAAEAVELFNKIVKDVQDVRNVEIVICPSFHYLAVLKHLNISTIKLGSQNTFVKKEEANDQKISWPEVKKYGGEFAIVGHSSRRVFLGQKDESINQELKEVLSLGLTPIFCVGETAKERKNGQTEIVLNKQINEGLAGLSNNEISKIIIAYEPVWAISGGDPYATEEIPTPGKIREIKILIRKMIGDVVILYGASANAANAKGFLEEAGMDGLLVGGASLDAKEFVKIVKSV
jgi:triosephosphate isomerase (TIM)